MSLRQEKRGGEEERRVAPVGRSWADFLFFRKTARDGN